MHYISWTRSRTRLILKRKWILCFVFILVFLSGHILFLHQSASIQHKFYKPAEAQKVVLLDWNLTEVDPHYLNESSKACPKCLFTDNTTSSYYNISEAVVFHATLSPSPGGINRPKNQIWIWYYMEAPKSVSIDEGIIRDHFPNIFNWTMTFRKDSDIFTPYGRIYPFQRPNSFSSLQEKWSYILSEEERKNGVYDRSLMPVPTIQDLHGRELAACIVSHCKSFSKRHLILKELEKYVHIDIYGGCGELKCPTGRTELNLGIDCRTSIASKYKFYLAFENNICEDYVTEKFFRTLRTQMIPVVYGGANYSEIAPKNSYISVTDFESIKDLADYLIYLDKNPSEYLKYFEWRKHYWAEEQRLAVQLCTLCDKLWNLKGDANAIESKSYPHMMRWWTYRSDRQDPINGENACVSPNKLKIFQNITMVDLQVPTRSLRYLKF